MRTQPSDTPSFDVESTLPLFGRTQVENEDTVQVLIALRNHLAADPRVQEWQASVLPIIARELGESGKIDATKLLGGAEVICKELGLPSIFVAHELYTHTWKRGIEQSTDISFTEMVWATPGNEKEIRQGTEELLTDALRKIADDIEAGGFSDVPWNDYRDYIRAILALIADRVIRFSKDLDEQLGGIPAGRRRTSARIKAEVLYHTQVGGEDGKVSVRRMAAILVKREPKVLATSDEENARRTLHEWLRDLKRQLLLDPPTL